MSDMAASRCVQSDENRSSAGPPPNVCECVSVGGGGVNVQVCGRECASVCVCVCREIRHYYCAYYTTVTYSSTKCTCKCMTLIDSEAKVRKDKKTKQHLVIMINLLPSDGREVFVSHHSIACNLGSLTCSPRQWQGLPGEM